MWLEPGKRPPRNADTYIGLKKMVNRLSFAVQGGDTRDQNLLQFFLNMVEFGMTVQESVESTQY